MTDRVRGFTVTLSNDIRIDDVEDIIKAISMIKGVLHVEPRITTPDDHMSEVRVRNAFREKFINFLNDEL